MVWESCLQPCLQRTLLYKYSAFIHSSTIFNKPAILNDLRNIYKSKICLNYYCLTLSATAVAVSGFVNFLTQLFFFWMFLDISGQIAVRSLTILKLKGVELLNNDYKINKENFALAIYYDIISISTCLKTRNSNQVNFGFCVYVEKL